MSQETGKPISHHFIRRRARARADYLNDHMTATEQARAHYKVRHYYGPVFRWCVVRVLR